MGWALNMTVGCRHYCRLSSLISQARIDFSKSNDLILLGDADETVMTIDHCPTDTTVLNPFTLQVTRLCEGAGWGEELARVEVETLEALVKGQD